MVGPSLPGWYLRKYVMITSPGFMEKDKERGERRGHRSYHRVEVD